MSPKCSLLVRAGTIATVPATPSTLEDYAGRNCGNGIEPPNLGKRTVTVPVFVWNWYEADAKQQIWASVRSDPDGLMRRKANVLCASTGLAVQEF
jgi:hypothetical protein